MNVLVTGTEGSGIDEVERRFRAARHGVFSCGVSPGSDAACTGSANPDSCPARSGVDVIVAARIHPLPHLTTLERLTNCPLLSEIPVVVTGSTVLNPYGRRATAFVEGFDGVVEVAEAVASTTSDVPSM